MNKRILLSIVAILMLFFGVAYFILNIPINKILSTGIFQTNYLASRIEPDDNMLKAAEVVNEKTPEEMFEDEINRYSTKSPENILIVGIDAPNIDNLEVQKNGATGVRTDTIMIANIDKDGNVNITSIPRDSRVILRGRKDKINHAHSYGGVDLLVDTIKDNFDIEIDRYIRVDYNMVKEVVDQIGGVPVEVDKKMYHYDPTPELGVLIDFEPGEYLLDGDEAIKFLRYRPNDEGDIGRVKSQQYFLKQLAEEVFDVGILKASKIFIDTSFKNVDTNLTLGEVFSLVKRASKSDIDKINFNTLDGVGKYINKVSYYIYSDLDSSPNKEILEIYKKEDQAY